MLNFIKKTDEEELAINITSMIDVIFILLIFFMVSTQFKKNSLPLDLPKSEDTTQEKNDRLKVLTVSESEIQFDGITVSMDELESVLSETLSLIPDISVSLECDKTVNFERVVQILTKLQNAGIATIGIVHEQPE